MQIFIVVAEQVTQHRAPDSAHGEQQLTAPEAAAWEWLAGGHTELEFGLTVAGVDRLPIRASQPRRPQLQNIAKHCRTDVTMSTGNRGT